MKTVHSDDPNPLVEILLLPGIDQRGPVIFGKHFGEMEEALEIVACDRGPGLNLYRQGVPSVAI